MLLRIRLLRPGIGWPRVLRRNSPDLLWLTLIAGLAVALRLVNIGRDSLWLDEALSYLAAILPAPVIMANTVQSSHPPLCYLVLHFWRAWLPDTDVAVQNQWAQGRTLLTIALLFGMSDTFAYSGVIL